MLRNAEEKKELGRGLWTRDVSERKPCTEVSSQCQGSAQSRPLEQHNMVTFGLTDW